MREKAVFLGALLIVCILCATFIIPISIAQDELYIGVAINDWATYGNVNAAWSSSDPNVHPGPDFVEANGTAWLKNTIMQKTKTESEDLGTEVGIVLKSTIHFKNGSETDKMLYVDLVTGIGNGSLTLIPAYVYTGEFIYPISVEQLLYVNETSYRVYLGVERETSHLNISSSYTSSASSEISISIDYHWDIVTGIMTEHRETFYNRTGNFVTQMSISDEIIETNLWSQPTEPPQNPSVGSDNTWMWILGLSMLGVAVTALVLYKRKASSRHTYKGRPRRR
jgi:hypothetical protein